MTESQTDTFTHLSKIATENLEVKQMITKATQAEHPKLQQRIERGQRKFLDLLQYNIKLALEHKASIYALCEDHARRYIALPYYDSGFNVGNPFPGDVFKTLELVEKVEKERKEMDVQLMQEKIDLAAKITGFDKASYASLHLSNPRQHDDH